MLISSSHSGSNAFFLYRCFLLNLNNKLIAFYENTEKQILEIEGLVNESINTKS